MVAGDVVMIVRGEVQTRFAVYGTLAPGRSNHYQIAGLRGTWRTGTVRGRLLAQGWGAALGYPGLVLDPQGERVAVHLLASADLPAHWARLDAFEGEGYRRVVAVIETSDGEAEACIYVLAGPSDGAEEKRVSQAGEFHNLDQPDDGLLRELAPGLVARIFAGEHAMLSVVTIAPGGEGTLHQHPEEQWGVLLEGSAIRVQGGEEIAVKAGDFWRTPGGVPHTMRAGPEGARVLDIFSPPRPEYRTAGSGFGTGGS